MVRLLQGAAELLEAIREFQELPAKPPDLFFQLPDPVLEG